MYTVPMACTDVVEKERSSLGFAFVMLLLAYVIITAVATAEALFIVLALSRRSILPQLLLLLLLLQAIYMASADRILMSSRGLSSLLTLADSIFVTTCMGMQ